MFALLSVHPQFKENIRTPCHSLAFVRGIHQWPVNSLHKRPFMWKMFPFDDIIMTKLVFRQNSMQSIGNMPLLRPQQYFNMSSRKCPQTPNMNSFTQSKWCQFDGNQQTMSKISSEGGHDTSAMHSPKNAWKPQILPFSLNQSGAKRIQQTVTEI